MKFNFKLSDNRALYDNHYLHTYGGATYLMKYIGGGIYTLTNMQENRVIMRDLTIRFIEDSTRLKQFKRWKISKFKTEYDKLP